MPLQAEIHRSEKLDHLIKIRFFFPTDDNKGR